MSAVRHTKLLVTMDKEDVSEEISHDLLSFSYTDKESDEADSVTFTLKDNRRKWAGEASADSQNQQKAPKVTAILQLFEGGVCTGTLFCGSFTVDSLRFSGHPRTVEISGVSVPLEKPIRRCAKSRSWENSTLKTIAGQLAEESGLRLFWDVAEDVSYDRIDQNRETDLAFLARLAKEDGISIKVTDSQLVMFDQASYEKKQPAALILLGSSVVTSWDFSFQKGESYKSVSVAYRDPKQKGKKSASSYQLGSAGSGTATKNAGNPAVMKATVTDPDVGEEGQEFEFKRRASSQAEAERLAKAKLRELNARSVTGSLTLAGDPRLCAGMVIALAGWGAWDGNFIIEEARHEVSSGGYTTSLNVRRVQKKY